MLIVDVCVYSCHISQLVCAGVHTVHVNSSCSFINILNSYLPFPFPYNYIKRKRDVRPRSFHTNTHTYTRARVHTIRICISIYVYLFSHSVTYIYCKKKLVNSYTTKMYKSYTIIDNRSFY